MAMAAGGSLDMKNNIWKGVVTMKKKTKGAWEIHVREVVAGQDINAEHGRCSLPLGNGISHHEVKQEKPLREKGG